MEFDAFVREHLPAFVRFAAAVTGDRGLAEDLVQDVLIRAHRRWDHVRALDDPERYLQRALVNAYLSWRRKWARYVPHAAVPDRPSPGPDHATRIAERSELAAEIARLPARQRAALVLRFYSSMSDEQIADALGCRPVTVRGYVSRGLKALRGALT